MSDVATLALQKVLEMAPQIAVLSHRIQEMAKEGDKMSEKMTEISKIQASILGQFQGVVYALQRGGVEVNVSGDVSGGLSVADQGGVINHG